MIINLDNMGRNTIIIGREYIKREVLPLYVDIIYEKSYEKNSNKEKILSILMLIYLTSPIQLKVVNPISLYLK